jgi:UDP-N-acetylglucosamine--N-acetylmuramyl-(pentapeptide) pyrophosphoryl-undecaprenol N-acetylglucosamine transferase
LPTRTEIRGIFAAGVTGGHIYPALAVADEISKIVDLKALFIGTGRGAEPKIFRNFKYDYVVIHAVGSDASKLKYIYKNAIASIRISKLLDKFRPDFVFTTGGYIGGITGYTAHKKGIPVFLHESNVEPGISTKKLSSYSKISFCAFEKTAEILQNGLYVGMPVREGFDLERDEAFIQKFPMKKILAFGGSEGSSVIDEIVDVISAKMENVVFFHIGRKIDKPNVVNYDYYDDIPYLMRNCDLVISRAGASTIGEIIQSTKPALLVPWKGSLNAHQEANAKYLADLKSAFVIDEDKIDFDEIVKIISTIFDPSFYVQASEALKKIRPLQKPSMIIAKEITGKWQKVIRH